jgi:ferric-dicitrate binding protein FerR (iron transport regulator)
MFKYSLVIALTLLLAGGTWYWFKAGASKPLAAGLSDKSDSDALPGGNRARLLLSDGTAIILLDSVNGVLALDGHGKTQIYKENGWLSYRSADMADSLFFNTLKVASGEQYKVMLPDGSRVWLNAGASLRYPVVFAGHERKVELSGEAYFEVAGLAGKEPGYTIPTVRTGNHNPFVLTVPSPSGNVQMRTAKARLNVIACSDDPVVHITLLDGIAQLINSNRTLTLKAGAQGLLSSVGQISVIDKDNRVEALAWKDGMFRFRQAGIQSIMKEVARWYNVKVLYKDSIAHLFTGDIQRTLPLSQLLSVLESTGQVHFQLQDKYITVTR